MTESIRSRRLRKYSRGQCSVTFTEVMENINCGVFLPVLRCESKYAYKHVCRHLEEFINKTDGDKGIAGMLIMHAILQKAKKLHGSAGNEEFRGRYEALLPRAVEKAMSGGQANKVRLVDRPIVFANV